jgi:hypothetical protein
LVYAVCSGIAARVSIASGAIPGRAVFALRLVCHANTIGQRVATLTGYARADTVRALGRASKVASTSVVRAVVVGGTAIGDVAKVGTRADAVDCCVATLALHCALTIRAASRASYVASTGPRSAIDVSTPTAEKQLVSDDR